MRFFSTAGPCMEKWHYMQPAAERSPDVPLLVEPEDDYVEAQRAVLTAMRVMARVALPAELQPPPTWPEESQSQLLFTGLSAWASACPRPLVLFFDEIDALRGKGLQSVLRQLRAGYSVRPHAAPWAVALCDVRDYKAASGGDASRLGTPSPFNIKVDSLRLGEFTPPRWPRSMPSTRQTRASPLPKAPRRVRSSSRAASPGWSARSLDRLARRAAR